MTKHTKDSLIKAVSMQTGLTQKDCKAVIEAAFSLIGSIPTGDSQIIAGFGKFTAKLNNARSGRNPKTGESIVIEERRALVFKEARS